MGQLKDLRGHGAPTKEESKKMEAGKIEGSLYHIGQRLNEIEKRLSAIEAGMTSLLNKSAGGAIS